MKQDLTLLIPMYNKAPYIERMVKSLSEQTYLDQTEIIVADDKSTDDSVEILKYCAEKYFVPMTLVMNDENLGLARNIRGLYRMIETEFWAVLDPDDYYIHPERLSRAVNFLKTHPDFSMHACNYYREEDDGYRKLAFSPEVKNFSISDYTEMPFFQTSAGTFRNFWNDKILKYIEQAIGKRRYHFSQGDSFRNFVAAQNGKIYVDNFIGSAYSLQKSGIWSQLSPFEQHIINSESFFQMSQMAWKFFHNYETAKFLLKKSIIQYLCSADDLNEMIKNLSMNKFTAKKYTYDLLNLKVGDIESMFKFLIAREKEYVSYGVRMIENNIPRNSE